MVTWFGHAGDALARALDLPRVVAETQVDSTMDTAHAIAAAGAAAGTLVLAEEQTNGRGRNGKSWRSARRAGVWMTLIERPRNGDALEVLSLRIGLALAPVLQRWVPRAIQLKWPNDLLVDGRKLAGVLVEARWRNARPDWVCIGVGINIAGPGRVAAAVDPATEEALVGADPRDVVAESLPVLRAAAFAQGALREEERAAFAARDASLGLVLTEPVAGTARGISASGELLVETSRGVIPYRVGSLVLASLT